MSAYRTAIDLTTQTIDKRSRFYRNLIIAVVLTSLTSISWAVVIWSLLPLSGFFLLFPICGLFFIIDVRVLNQWRIQLLQSWIRKDIDFRNFYDAINSISILPKNTLQGMLTTVPIATDIIEEQTISSSTREAIAASTMVSYINQSDAMTIKVTGYIVVVCSLILSITLNIWQLLLMIFFVTLLPFLQKKTEQWRLKKSKAKVLAAQKQADFNQEIYLKYIIDFREKNKII